VVLAAQAAAVAAAEQEQIPTLEHKQAEEAQVVLAVYLFITKGEI
jgi:hypothetical protein